MGFSAELGRIIPDKFKPPLRAKSFSQYVDFLQREGAVHVELVPSREKAGNPSSVESEPYTYNAELRAKSKTGRGIVLRQDFTTTGIRHGMLRQSKAFDHIQRQEEHLIERTYLTAKRMLDHMKEVIPGLTGNVMDKNAPFSDEQYEELEKRAQQGLEPWDFAPTNK